MNTKLIVTEAQIQITIIEYLRRKGWYVQRMNSGSIKTQGGGFVRMATGGTPDLMAFRQTNPLASHIISTRLIFVEVKRPGKKPTLLQSEKMKELRGYGAECYVAHSVEELISERL